MSAQVVHITTAHTATDTRIFDKQALSLANAGYDVTLLAHNDRDESRQGVDIQSLGTANSRPDRWKHIYAAANQARQIDADIYHFHDPELLPVGLYLRERTNAAVIYDVHEDFGHIISTRNWIPGPLKPILSMGFPFVQNNIARRFDALVTVSDWIADTLPDGVRTEIVRNFPRTTTLPDVSGDIDRNHEYILVYVGGLSEVRGIMRMLRLVKELRDRGLDVGFWALGPWQNSKQASVKFIDDYELSEHVRFPGFVDYETMFRWLRSADVGLALLDKRHYECGIPTKFFEYMYAGLPIVGTRIDAAQRFLYGESYYRSVPQTDTEQQADTVEKVLKADFNGVSEQAQQDVEQQFSWEQEFQTLECLYEELLR